jgi:hypothetical protein
MFSNKFYRLILRHSRNALKSCRVDLRLRQGFGALGEEGRPDPHQRYSEVWKLATTDTE